MKCYTCPAEIHFDDNVKSKTGKKIPLNVDGSYHQCPNKQQFKDTAQKIEKEITSKPQLPTKDTHPLEKIVERLDKLQEMFQDNINLHKATLKKLGLFETADGKKVENQKGLDAVTEGDT